jgi:hypothetical protein
MADKSVPQLDAVTTLADDDLFHVVVSNVDKKITKANLAEAILGTSTSPVIYSATATINSAALSTSNTTPILLIAAAGAGKGIVLLGSTTITSTYGTATYAANTTMQIYTDTATDPQLLFQTVLNNTSTRTTMGALQQGTSAGDTQIIANKGIYIKTNTGDPTTGDGSITVNIQYIIIDL